jgi:hypothetical protein
MLHDFLVICRPVAAGCKAETRGLLADSKQADQCPQVSMQPALLLAQARARQQQQKHKISISSNSVDAGMQGWYSCSGVCTVAAASKCRKEQHCHALPPAHVMSRACTGTVCWPRIHTTRLNSVIACL